MEVFKASSIEKFNYDMLRCLFNEMPKFSLTGENFKAYIEKIQKNGIIFYTKKNQDITSFIGFYANDRETFTAYLSCIVVSPHLKGSGIAQQLFDKMCDVAISNGMKRLKFTVLKENLRAISFYKKNKMFFKLSLTDETRWDLEKDLI